MHPPYMNSTTTFPRVLSLAILGTVLSLLAYPQQAVNGYLKIADKQYEMTHITAIRVPNVFHDDQFATRISLSDLPVTEQQLRDTLGVARLRGHGRFHGVTLEIGDERSYISMNLWSSDHDTIISMTGTIDELELMAQTPELIIGQVKNFQQTMNNLTFELTAGFSAALKQPPAEPKRDMKTGAAAAELESVRVYLAMRKAVRAGNMPTIRKLARYPQDFEGPEGEKFVKLMQAEEPLNLEVVEASEADDTARLTVKGILEGKEIRRTFQMLKLDGKWSTKNDNWQAN